MRNIRRTAGAVANGAWLSNMRIAFICFHTSPLGTLGGKDTGGMNVFVREAAREFARRGSEVDIFVRSTSPQLMRIDPRIAPGVRVIHVPAGPEVVVPKADLRQYVNGFAEWICEFHEQELLAAELWQRGPVGGRGTPMHALRRYDVIHAHYWLSGLAAEQLAKCWNRKWAMTFHTLAELKNQIALRPEDLESNERLQGECHLTEVADRITAATQVEWTQLVHMYGAGSSRIRIVPPGVDTAVFTHVEQGYAKRMLGVKSDHRLIVFAGRIEPLKGIDTLLKAIAHLRNSGALACSSVCVSIIGGDPSEQGVRSNPEMARLQALRKELDIDDLITFDGAQDQDSLHLYFSAADCVVMPSHYESFGMVALEAMACGTPVIASDVGGLSKLVRDEETGLLFEARDHVALAEQIERILGDDAFRRRMGHRAECYAQDYSWQRIVDKLQAVYQELTA